MTDSQDRAWNNMIRYEEKAKQRAKEIAVILLWKLQILFAEH